MAKHLITQKRFLPYFCTQFLGVLNDGLYRYAFAILVTYYLAKDNYEILVNVALMVFILPFFLFGAIAGQLADKYEKTMLIRRIKIAECLIMLFGSVALYYQSLYGMLFTLFALGTQSTFFGPIKYSILPQHLNTQEILTGNAYVEASTFFGILLGTIIGGYLAYQLNLHWLLICLLLVIASTGWFASRLIPDAQPAAPDLKISFNVWASTWRIIGKTRENGPVFKSILAISWFWFFSSVLQTQFPGFAKDILSGGPNVTIALMSVFAIGIALGSYASSLLSGGKVEIGLMPFGAIGMSVFTWLLSGLSLPPADELRSLAEVFQYGQTWLVVFYLGAIAFFAGLYIVPLYAFLQTRSNPSQRSRTIAVNNILNSLFMVIAGGMSAVLFKAGFDVADIFKVVAVINLLVTIYIITVVPEFFLRLVSWVLVHSVYRVDKKGLENIPKEGPALLVCNHVSFFDPPILLAVIPRPARFIMWYGFYELPVVKWMFKGLNAIPIGNRKQRPELVDKAFDSVAQALENGELVVVFPEGAITRDGEIARFQPGMDDILKRTPVPVVPIAIQGMWGTWWSRHKGRAMSGLPKSFMKRVTVVADQAVDADQANRVLMEAKVRELRGEHK